MFLEKYTLDVEIHSLVGTRKKLAICEETSIERCFICTYDMLLICAALPAELKVAKACRAKKGVQFLCTGVGNYRTIFSLTTYLSTHPEVDELLFVGVCGWRETKQEIVQVANVINAHTGKEIILPIAQKKAPLVTMLSSETPIHDVSLMREYQYVDMESRGVALVAEQCRLPCTILRVPIDEIGAVSCATFDRAEAIEQMRRICAGVSL